MNADTCKDFLKALELYHDKKFSSVARDTYWAGLKDYDDEKIVLLLQVTYGKFPPGRVPSIDDLKSLLGEIRDVAQAKERGAELANRRPLWRSAESSRPMIEESFAMLSRLFCPAWPLHAGDPDKLTVRQCVSEMIEMEEKYPGVGWRQGAEQLRTWLDKKDEQERGAVDKELKEIELRALAELAKERA